MDSKQQPHTQKAFFYECDRQREDGSLYGTEGNNFIEKHESPEARIFWMTKTRSQENTICSCLEWDW